MDETTREVPAGPAGAAGAASAAAAPAPAPVLDLDAYLGRIGYDGPVEPSREVLFGLHRQHATRVPFENLDVLLGRPVRLDLASLQAKLVSARRGGYCFEQDLLFSAVLREIGFPVTMLAARVRAGTTRLLPRTHMTLLVTAGGREWLADVGFGAGGLLEPVPFGAGEEARHGAWSYRAVRTAGAWVLQSRVTGDWADLYAFTLEPQEVVDYEVANHYVSTHPSSRFVKTLTAQRMTEERRITLRDRELLVDDGTTAASSLVPGGDPLLDLLRETFGIELPAGTRFPVLEASPEPAD